MFCVGEWETTVGKNGNGIEEKERERWNLILARTSFAGCDVSELSFQFGDEARLNAKYITCLALSLRQRSCYVSSREDELWIEWSHFPVMNTCACFRDRCWRVGGRPVASGGDTSKTLCRLIILS